MSKDAKDPREKITLGKEQFDHLPEVQKKEDPKEEAPKGKEKKDLVEPEQVVVQKEEKSFSFKKPKKVQMVGLLGAVVLIFILFAETLRRSIFRAEDSLIFQPKGGFLIPSVGIVLIVVGLALVYVAFTSLFHKRGKLTKQQKGIALLLGIVVAFVGFTSFFRYVDYTETRIIDRSIFFTREATYMDVQEVHASTYQEGENNRLNYHYKLQNGRSYDVKVSESNMEAVKSIDGKIRSTTKRSIDNFAILEMERLGMYSKDEALNLFILE
ncbi:MAG TPA: hypothetical protein DEA52_04845 [Clostridiaceae bacterium]|nr:hypothetical protein [Clostridiaceae bacterium]